MLIEKYVSGIRPSGQLHLGNYLGALKHWKALQEAGKAYCWFVADMHGQPSLSEVNATVEALHKCGIEVDIQSYYSGELLELAHGLSFYVTTGQLERMTQYKDKISNRERPTLALFSYPVLMAADILYHDATHVPVGADQKQHVEFVRDLVDVIGKETGFIKPEPVIHPTGSRIMSLTDPNKKMSKSDPNDSSRINLGDDADTIRRKLKKAVSNEAGMQNLVNICRALGCEAIPDGNERYKSHIADLIIKEFGL